MQILIYPAIPAMFLCNMLIFNMLVGVRLDVYPTMYLLCTRYVPATAKHVLLFCV